MKKRGTCRHCANMVGFNSEGVAQCSEGLDRRFLLTNHIYNLNKTCSWYYPSFTTHLKPTIKRSFIQVTKDNFFWWYTAVCVGILVGGLFLAYVRRFI